MLLSICIPTFNRINSLKNCLNSILISNKFSNDFDYEVCVSDNCSKEDISSTVLEFKKKLNIVLNINSENLGFSRNAIKCISMARGKFVWMIGNDDLVLPNALNKIKYLITNNLNTDYFFLNSCYLDSNFLKKFPHPFDTSLLNTEKLDSICKLKKDKKTNFWGVINPNVSWEFLMGIFLSLFNKNKYLENIDLLNQKNLADKRLWSNFDNTCSHAKILSSAFKDSDSYICAEPLSVNLIGLREWAPLYEFIEIVRIPELLDYYKSLGFNKWKYYHCKNFALRNFFNYFFKIFIRGELSGSKYVNFKKHIFYNLLYPNVWFSLFYFFIRKILNLKKKI
jgi:glycosyltransferase involved in cell wall biosynthesis